MAHEQSSNDFGVPGQRQEQASPASYLYLYSQAATLSYLTRRYDASDPNLTLPAAPSS